MGAEVKPRGHWSLEDWFSLVACFLCHRASWEKLVWLSGVSTCVAGALGGSTAEPLDAIS